MITSSKSTVLGSENCSPVVHRKYSCGTVDFLITAIELDSETGTLTIYQNPDNCVSVNIAELLAIHEIQDKFSELINNKVDKAYFLHTSNGIQGGGTLQNELTLSIKSNDDHIEVSPGGLKIKEFTEVTTSGTVPSPEQSKNTEKHFLNAKGEWTKLAVLQFKGVIEASITIPNPDTGDMYVIKDLGEPSKTVIVNGQTFLSTDVIIWDGTKFVDIGQVSVRVNLGLDVGTETITITNTAGKGIVLPKVSTDKAGLMTVTDKTNLETLHTRSVVTSLQDAIPTGTTVSFTFTSIKTGETATTASITIPAAGPNTAGVMTRSDKSNLDDLVSRAVVTNITGTPSSSNYTITATKNGSNSPAALTINAVGFGGTNLAGLMTKADKDKLDDLQGTNLQSNWGESVNTTPAYIKNKPPVLGTVLAFDGFLVPKPGGLTDANLFLNIEGEWKAVKSTPPITRSETEPVGDRAVEGAIWLVP